MAKFHQRFKENLETKAQIVKKTAEDSRKEAIQYKILAAKQGQNPAQKEVKEICQHRANLLEQKAELLNKKAELIEEKIRLAAKEAKVAKNMAK